MLAYSHPADIKWLKTSLSVTIVWKAVTEAWHASATYIDGTTIKANTLVYTHNSNIMQICENYPHSDTHHQ